MSPLSSIRWGLRATAMAASLFLAAAVAAQAVDHLGVPGPITHDGRSYALAWTSRPSPDYTKQEYVPAGQTVERFDEMLLVETLTGKIGVMDAVGAQVDKLKKRKATDPLVNMEVIQNKASGEALLDFVLSARDPKGELIVEWSAYRYAPYRDAKGHSGVQLLGVSHRAYGSDAARAFLGELKQVRPGRIRALTSAKLPL